MIKAVRLLNFAVIVALVLAAAYVYKIKFESTLRAERLAKVRSEIRRERDAIATLRAEWSALDNPARIQGLVQRHLNLKPIEPGQFESVDRIPMRPPQATPEDADPIGTIIEDLDELDLVTGSLRTPAETSHVDRAQP